MSDPVRIVLLAARRLVFEPEYWTRNARARDAFGRPASPLSAHAVSYCALGAIEAAVGGRDSNQVLFRQAVWAMAETLDDAGPGWISSESRIVNWNDNRETGHPAVLAAFEVAAAVGLRRMKWDEIVHGAIDKPCVA